MAFDPEHHSVDPATGFHVHKDGRPVGLVPAPIARVNHDSEWPKWVAPHPGHIARNVDYLNTPHWPDHHINRSTGEVTVLVRNEEEEARAFAAPEDHR